MASQSMGTTAVALPANLDIAVAKLVPGLISGSLEGTSRLGALRQMRGEARAEDSTALAQVFLACGRAPCGTMPRSRNGFEQGLRG